MSKVITVRINFEVNTQKAEEKLERTALKAQVVRQILSRTISLINRMGLPEDAQAIMTVMTRMISIGYQLIALIKMLDFAMASGPGGWLLAGLMGLSIAMDVADLAGSI